MTDKKPATGVNWHGVVAVVEYIFLIIVTMLACKACCGVTLW